MFRVIIMASIVWAVLEALPTSHAQKSIGNTVIEHIGEHGDLIVSRNGIVYFLTEGDAVHRNDVLRARYEDTSTIMYQGCVMTLPEGKDVKLDDDFCAFAAVEEKTMAERASEGTIFNETTGTNAPFMIGGVIVSAGGLAAATNGGNNGTGSATSSASGVVQGGVDP